MVGLLATCASSLASSSSSLACFCCSALSFLSLLPLKSHTSASSLRGPSGSPGQDAECGRAAQGRAAAQGMGAPGCVRPQVLQARFLQAMVDCSCLAGHRPCGKTDLAVAVVRPLFDNASGRLVRQAGLRAVPAPAKPLRRAAGKTEVANRVGEEEWVGHRCGRDLGRQLGVRVAAAALLERLDWAPDGTITVRPIQVAKTLLPHSPALVLLLDHLAIVRDGVCVRQIHGARGPPLFDSHKAVARAPGVVRQALRGNVTDRRQGRKRWNETDWKSISVTIGQRSTWRLSRSDEQCR